MRWLQSRLRQPTDGGSAPADRYFQIRITSTSSDLIAEGLTDNVACEVELSPRRCEEPLRRSNPFSLVRGGGLLRCARNDRETALFHGLHLFTGDISSEPPGMRSGEAQIDRLHRVEPLRRLGQLRLAEAHQGEMAERRYQAALHQSDAGRARQP